MVMINTNHLRIVVTMATAGAAEVVGWRGGPFKDIGHWGEGEGGEEGEEVFNIQRIKAAAGNEDDEEEEEEEAERRRRSRRRSLLLHALLSELFFHISVLTE